MKRIVFCTLVGAFLMANTGCMTMAKRTLKEAKGASSDSEIVPGTGGANLAKYTGAQIAAPRTEAGGLVSTEFKSELTTALRKFLITEDEAPLKGSSPMVSIEPVVQWYHRGGVGGLMPEKYAVVMYYLKENGSEVGRVQIVTKSEAARTGDESLAESNAEELASFFKKQKEKKS